MDKCSGLEDSQICKFLAANLELIPVTQWEKSARHLLLLAQKNPSSLEIIDNLCSRMKHERPVQFCEQLCELDEDVLNFLLNMT